MTVWVSGSAPAFPRQPERLSAEGPVEASQRDGAHSGSPGKLTGLQEHATPDQDAPAWLRGGGISSILSECVVERRRVV